MTKADLLKALARCPDDAVIMIGVRNEYHEAEGFVVGDGDFMIADTESLRETGS